MRSAGKDPGDLFDPSKPDYIKTPFDLVPQLVPHGPASESPQLGPTEPDRAGEAPQAPDPGSQPDTPPKAPSPDDGHSPPTLSELPPEHASPDSAANSVALPDQSPHADATVVETQAGKPPLNGDQAPAANRDAAEATESAPDVGYIESGIRNALQTIGIEPEKARDAAAAIALVASLHPAIGVPLGLDDLQVAIRRHDIPGILLATAGFIPGARAARLLRRRPKVPSTAKLSSSAASKARTTSSFTPKDSDARLRLKKAGVGHLTPRVDPEKTESMIRNGSAVRDGNELTFRSRSALRRAIGRAPPGHEWHHLAEQRKSNNIGAHHKHRTDNVLAIPKLVHRKVSAFYSTKSSSSAGSIFRHELNGLPFDEQHKIGIGVLLRFFKLIPPGAP
jgi:hypothetical protein